MTEFTKQEKYLYSKALKTREFLHRKFPLAFMGFGEFKRPLKLGIHLDIIRALDANGEVVTYERMGCIDLAIKDYTSGAGYLRAMVAGAERIDLDGKPAGTVSPEHAAEAATRLKEAYQTKVDSALRRAHKNGYDMANLGDPALIASDLMDCDVIFAGADLVTVTTCCADWLYRQRLLDGQTS